MAIITYDASNTTLTLNGTVISDFMEGDFISLSKPNNLTERTNGINGAVSIQKRVDAEVANLVVRVQKNSPSDLFFNTTLNSPSITIFNGSIKESYIIDKQKQLDNYILENGSITAQPSIRRNNQEGVNTVEYKIQFRNVTRV